MSVSVAMNLVLPPRLLGFIGATFALLFGGFVSGCTSGNKTLQSPYAFPETTDSRFDTGKLSENDEGLIVCFPTKVLAPTSLQINNKPSKIVTFAGVAGPDEKKEPELYQEAAGHLYYLLKEASLPIFIRKMVGSNTDADAFKGSVLLAATNTQNNANTGYFEVTQAMLSLGYLRITDAAEFQNPVIAESMMKRENEARLAGRGMWKKRS